jgi:hypothetical protein
MLVVNFHTLATVDLLDLTDKVILNLLFSLDAKNIVRNKGAVDE